MYICDNINCMDVANFNALLELLRNRLQRFSKRKPISSEIRLSLTLLFLEQSTNRANCLGAIDGKHIRIVCPKKSGSLYFNYKKHFSIVLLASCDPNYTFTYVDVGALGSQSDGGIFARSIFGRKILGGTLEVPLATSLPGGTIFPYYFVADNAFPLKTNLMRPYPARTLSEDKKVFYEKLSKARVYIENAFGILASRWRVLHTSIHAEPENADKIVLASVVLHNFLMLKRDTHYFRPDLVDRTEDGIDIEGDWRRETTPLTSVRQPTANRSAALQLRDMLKDFLN